MSFADLREYITALRGTGDLVEVQAEVDPKLELAEIHRRVIAQAGPAILFQRVKGSAFPVLTNMFGTKARVDLAFGDQAKKVVSEASKLPEELFPPSFKALWRKRQTLLQFAKIGIKRLRAAPVLANSPPVDLEKLPVITSWEMDGGPFFTLPLVYTQHPDSGVPNLGMYRLQRFDSETTGMHIQIGKGGGFHLARSRQLNQPLQVNVFLGGPPGAILSAIAPLPENVPELLLASLAIGKKLRMVQGARNGLPMLADAEFVLSGEIPSDEVRPEGPFGDHYGYYSLKHDFPIFRCKQVFHRENAIYPATVVGKPRQEDFYIGNYLQELLSPLFPLAMPSVRDLWSYGETGYHSLAAAVVHERYKREAMMSAFRILGEGQLSLTKFLLLLDKPIDLKNFRAVLEHVLERADMRTDLYVFSNLSMDTLDYTGPKLNEGSKGVLIGIGAPRRELPREWNRGLPPGIEKIKVFCPGCIVVSPQNSRSDQDQIRELVTSSDAFQEWPLVVLADDAELTCESEPRFLWTVFTRFEPAADIHARSMQVHRFHPTLEGPIFIDARMKPNYPDELFCDETTSQIVDKRWGEYFPNSKLERNPGRSF